MTIKLEVIELLMADNFSNMAVKGNTILITGSSGLIGTGLRQILIGNGYNVKGFDIRGDGEDFGDVRDTAALSKAIHGCVGVIHLAAVSRVIDGERNPELCWYVNVNGITNVIESILQQEHKPWLIFSSSREVYGNASDLPVKETQPCAPINIYGESKVKSELLVEEAVKNKGLQAAILRFSNVFGGLNDHEDRVIPAFVRAALFGEFLRVDGDDNTFDFTHLDDVLAGIVLTIKYLKETGNSLAPVHFVSGRPTTLRELAEMVIKLTGSNSDIIQAPPRKYDVARFFGSTERAGRVLDWYHKTPLETGLLKLAGLLKEHLYLSEVKQ